MASCFDKLDSKHYMKSSEMSAHFTGELGTYIPSYDTGRVIWGTFFYDASIEDVLDSITIYFKKIWRLTGNRDSCNFIFREVSRIFKEENVRYRIDAQCGVHLAIDSEYECSTASAVAGLGNPRYTAAKHAFDAAQAAQDRADPDFKEALRNVFEAVEVVFKLILPEVPRISSGDIIAKLKPRMTTIYAGSETATKVAGQYLDSLCDWVSSVHNYRHGQPLETAPQPPIALSVALMSSGVAYLRWLIEIDQALSAQSKEEQPE
ncbi:hypothetical protein JCM14124_29340 [Humidesulfovibrio idahonensis]